MIKDFPHYHIQGYINGHQYRSGELIGLFGVANANEAKQQLSEYLQELNFNWQSSGLCSRTLKDGEIDMDNVLSIEPCRWRDLSITQARRIKYLRMERVK